MLFLYSVSSVIAVALGFADENRIGADNLDIFPADADSLPPAADSPIFGLTVNNKRHHLAAAAVNLDITHKTYTAAV